MTRFQFYYEWNYYEIDHEITPEEYSTYALPENIIDPPWEYTPPPATPQHSADNISVVPWWCIESENVQEAIYELDEKKLWGSLLNVNTTPIGNIWTWEDDLISYTLPWWTLSANWQIIEVIVAWTVVWWLAMSSRRIKMYRWWTMIFDTGAIEVLVWWTRSIKSTIIRTWAETQKIISEFSTNIWALAIESEYHTSTETLSWDVVLKVTWESAWVWADDNNIVQELLIVKKFTA